MRLMPRRADHASDDSPQTLSAACLKRRRFLLALGAGTAGTAAAAAQAVTTAKLDAAVKAPAGSSGYQETDHVRDYYASARI